MKSWVGWRLLSNSQKGPLLRSLVSAGPGRSAATSIHDRSSSSCGVYVPSASEVLTSSIDGVASSGWTHFSVSRGYYATASESTQPLSLGEAKPSEQRPKRRDSRQGGHAIAIGISNAVDRVVAPTWEHFSTDTLFNAKTSFLPDGIYKFER